MRDSIFHKPFTCTSAYYGVKVGPMKKTMNVYNSFGVMVARAIDDDTAELIAAALNAYEIKT